MKFKMSLEKFVSSPYMWLTMFGSGLSIGIFISMAWGGF